MAHEEDGFLQRWSRRKQEAARRPAPPAAPPPSEPPAAAADESRRAAEDREREAVLARLPKLEDLTAESDFRLFMHPLVPAALRSAALARMWTLDPAIRDFVGPARDYAWDWNVPGGVPGGGPAPSLADIESMLRKLTARLDAEAARAAGAREDEAVAGPPADPPARPEVGRSKPAGVAPVAAPSDPTTITGPARPASEPATAPTRRRHGGATPV